MANFAKRFHLIAIAGVAGLSGHAAALAAGRGDSVSAMVGGALCLVLFGAAGFFSAKFVK